MSEEVGSMLEKIRELYEERDQIKERLNEIEKRIVDIKQNLISLRKKYLIFSSSGLIRFLLSNYEKNGYIFIDEVDDEIEISGVKYRSYYDGAEYIFIGKRGLIWFDEKNGKYILLITDGNLKTHVFWDKGCLEGTGHEYKSDTIVIAEIIVDSGGSFIRDKDLFVSYLKKNQKSIISSKFYTIHKNRIFLMNPFKTDSKRYVRDVSKLDFEYPGLLYYIY